MKTDEMFGELRRLNREHMHMIWEIAKTGDLDVLERDTHAIGREQRLPSAGTFVILN
jgi:hypothetical protein